MLDASYIMVAMSWDYSFSDSVVVEKAPSKVKPPRKWKVVLYNDDYTPMDFVVLVLMRFFGHSMEKAEQIMWQVHTQGKGVCGVYPKEIAETKMMQVNRFSRENGHPLLCQIEVNE